MTGRGPTAPRSDGAYIVPTAALLATYLQAVTTSIPNAALLHIQGSLSMADDQVGWIFTGYIAASAVTLPMTRWLAARHGRRLIYQLSIAIFALGLVLATRAETPLEFIGARIIQGAASGPLAPMSLLLLLELAPPTRHARVSLVWTVTLVFGILSGPTVGGWLTEYHGWQWIFYAGLPAAGFIFLVIALWVPEKKPGQVPSFDSFGVGTLTLGLIGLQLVLDRGERQEWFASPEIWAEAVASALGFYLFAVHILTARAHFLNKALLKDRNFVVSGIMFFAFGFLLLPTMALTSPMLDEILGYPPDLTGYVAIPRSIALLATLIAVNYVPQRIDRRALIALGSALVIYANWRMLDYAPTMYWDKVAAAGMFQGAGLGILMPVLSKTAFSTLNPELRPEGTVIFNLLRLYGSTIGVAVVLTFFYNSTEAMHMTLSEHVTASVAAGLSPQQLVGLNEMITGQAAFIGVVNQFKLLMVVMLVASPLVLLLKKPQAM